MSVFVHACISVTNKWTFFPQNVIRQQNMKVERLSRQQSQHQHRKAGKQDELNIEQRFVSELDITVLLRLFDRCWKQFFRLVSDNPERPVK